MSNQIVAAELEYHALCVEYVESVLSGHTPLGLADALTPAAHARQRLLHLETEQQEQSQ